MRRNKELSEKSTFRAKTSVSSVEPLRPKSSGLTLGRGASPRFQRRGLARPDGSKKRENRREIDDLDRKIIHELQEDARLPFKDIAKRLRVSEGTARNRVIKLIERGVLKLEAKVDPFALPNKIPALVGVSLRERNPEQKMKEIEKVPGVTSVWNTTGPYDLFFEVMVDSLEELNRMLLGIDRNYVRGVARTETFVVLSSNTKFFKLP